LFHLVSRFTSSLTPCFLDVIAEYISGQPQARDDASDAAWFDIENLDKETVDNNALRFLEAWRTKQLKVLESF